MNNLTRKEESILERSRKKNAGLIKFWLLVFAVAVIAPIELVAIVRSYMSPEDHGVKEYMFRVMLISIHIILLLKARQNLTHLRLIRKLTADSNKSSLAASK